jgi:hypothetical protein
LFMSSSRKRRGILPCRGEEKKTNLVSQQNDGSLKTKARSHWLRAFRTSVNDAQWAASERMRMP